MAADSTHKKNPDETKENFREAMYAIVQYMTKYELSSTAKSLLNHYFNHSRVARTSMRAFEAIEKYVQDRIPSPDDRPPKLARIIDELEHWADRWDAE